MYLIENQYFGSVNYFSELYSHSNIKIVECFGWYKMSFLNRCLIAGANGSINLTVPIKGGRNQKTRFSEVLVDNSVAWQKQHLRAIMSCYAKAPYFEHYFWWFEDLYNKKYEYVNILNKDSFFGIIKLLKLEIDLNGFFDCESESWQNFNGNFKKWLPSNYNTLTPNLNYTQVFEDKIGFLPNLSIIDGIFNLGPQLNFYLKQQSVILNHHFKQ